MPGSDGIQAARHGTAVQQQTAALSLATLPLPHPTFMALPYLAATLIDRD